jgi:hypothetical protein
MAQGAKVGSFEALRAFRAALYKFAETANIALGDAEGEMQRLVGWLERDQQSYWQFQLRKRTEDLTRCKEAVRMKKLFKGADGRPGSAVDEEKALVVAQRRLAAAEQKYKAVMAYSRKLPKDIILYKGQVQRLATALQSDIPVAGAQLSRIVQVLEAYAAVSGPAGMGGDAGGRLVSASLAAELSMSRGGSDAATTGWAHLRKKTPGGQTREQAPAANAPPSFKAATLAQLEREAIAALPGDRDAADGQARVVFAGELSAASRIYLERPGLSFPGDSGWYVGRADDGACDAGGSISMSDFLAARPDLAEVMALPTGFLVVIDGGGIVAVLDPGDQELWKPAGSEAAAEAPAPANDAPAAAAPAETDQPAGAAAQS